MNFGPMEQCFDRLAQYATTSNYQNSELLGFPRRMEASEEESEPRVELTAILAAVEEHTKAHGNHVHLLMQEQAEVARHPTHTAYTELLGKQERLIGAIKEVERVLAYVYTFMIPPQHLAAVERMKRAIIEMEKQVELLRMELEMLAEMSRQSGMIQGRIPALIALVVTHQKFPCVCYRGAELGAEDLQVRMLHGATVEFAEPSTITAVLESQYVDSMGLQNHEQVMYHGGPNANRAAFPLNFVKAISTDPVVVSFRATVHLRQLGMNSLLVNEHGGPITVECTTTDSFCVINRERVLTDFVGAVRELVHLDAFDSDPVCPWGRYANSFNRQFLLCTEQNLDRPQRPLSKSHLDYIHDRFFASGNEVTREQSEAFWQWFNGPLLTLAFAPVIQAMWNSGYIQGFMSKDTACQYVQAAETGAVILRFSESSGAILSLTVRTSRIRHFRVWNDPSGCPNIQAFLGVANSLAEGFSSIFQFNDTSTVWRTVGLDTLREQFK